MAASFFLCQEVNHLDETVYSATYMTAAEQMDTITAIMLEEKAQKIEVPMRNGDSFYFINTMTLGDALVTSSIFLLLVFMVLKWFLDTVWKRR